MLVVGPVGTKTDGFETLPVLYQATSGPAELDLPFDKEGFVVNPDVHLAPRVGFLLDFGDGLDRKSSELGLGMVETAPPEPADVPVQAPALA